MATERSQAAACSSGTDSSSAQGASATAMAARRSSERVGRPSQFFIGGLWGVKSSEGMAWTAMKTSSTVSMSE